MTECERIIQDGILNESFFEEELRNAFFVTRERKKIWAIQLDLFFKFQKICNKHGLKYFLFFGSLLGAVRHNGFIPWDDDIDIGMPRKDYEELLTHADDFAAPYFLQNHLTEKSFYYSHTKLRNSNTSCINRAFKHQMFNQGMDLDIHPIDNWELEGGKEKFEEIKKLNINNSTYMRIGNPDLTEGEIERIDNYNSNPDIDWSKIHKIASQYLNKKTDYMSGLVLTLYDYDRIVFKTKCFENTILYNFEGFEFPVPEGYEDILKTIYGDWKKLPPIKDRGHWHDRNVMKPDIPYREYLSSL